MKFSDVKYERPDIQEIKTKWNELLERFKKAESSDHQHQIIAEVNAIRDKYVSKANYVEIRYSANTGDKEFEAEQNFLDEIKPAYEQLISEYYQALTKSKFRKSLEDYWGSHLFKLAETSQKTISPDVIEDLKKENQLATQYMKLQSSSKIFFEGEERTVSQMLPFAESSDRDTRIRAHKAISGFWSQHSKEWDNIFDQLVKSRTQIAQKLGYENFVQLGYDRMLRTDYDHQQVRKYREEVIKTIVPISQELYQIQQKRLKIDHLYFYDESCTFPEGNPQPIGNPEQIIENANTMYHELSSNTGEFFDLMREKELLDLLSRPGKMQGGFCSYLPDKKWPFIFANFSGTSGDVDVLTHEAGHAFQKIMSRDQKIQEYIKPTMESCEIHSMSMEFLTWPWWDLFYGDQADRARYMHLVKSLKFIPYGTCVDEFQHFVYENPEASPADRKAKWSELEKTYLPQRDYEHVDYLKNGGFWHRQLHIFVVPFYYIDYTLAQVCAFQFWADSKVNRSETWQRYLDLCSAGGSQSFLGLLKLSGLNSPFEPGSLEKAVEVIKNWLNDFHKNEYR